MAGGAEAENEESNSGDELADVTSEWPEIARLLNERNDRGERFKEAVIIRDGGADGVDVALWKCTFLNTLRLRLNGGCASIGEGLGNLQELLTLVVRC